MVTKPMLPPKAGYIEIIDENGNHVYKPTAETEQRQNEKAVMDALIGDAQIANAEQTRAALQMYVATLPDEQKMIVATVFPAYTWRKY